MEKFVFLFRGVAQDQSPEGMQRIMQKWQHWMKELAEAGHLNASGEALQRNGKFVAGHEKLVTDGPFTETKEMVSGFIVVHAATIDDAVKISMGCPIYEQNGSVEVRPVMQMN